MSPRVTIGLPVFNGADFLAATIDSILSQDLEDFELIIADNASTDTTESICRAVLHDPRVRYERSDQNRGARWNYNRLMDLSNAEYFKWAAHDDELEPSFIRRCVEELDSAPEAVLAYPRTVLIDGAGSVIDDDFCDGLDLRDADPVQRFRRYLIHPGEQHPVFGVIRSKHLRSTGLIANCWGVDQVLLAELLLLGRFHEVPERLFRRRYHVGSSLVANATPADVARWYDPNKKGRTAMPRTRLTAELSRVVALSKLSTTDKVRCLVAVATDWIPMYARVIAGELKNALLARLSAPSKRARM